MEKRHPQILAYEDRELVRALRPEVLTKRGAVLRLFATAKQALDRASEAQPDILFAPLELPDLPGATLAERLHSLFGREYVPAVAVLRREDPAAQAPLPSPFEARLLLPTDDRTVATLLARLVGLRLREAERFPIRVRVFTDEYVGTTVDLSVAGMLVRTEKELPEDQTVELKFALPGSARRLQVPARVVRTDRETFRPHLGIALRFEPVSFPLRKELESYIASLVAGRTFHWTFVAEARGAVLQLRGRLTDPRDLLELSSHLSGPVRLDLSRFVKVHERAAKVWKSWLRGLDTGRGVPVTVASYELARQTADEPDLFERLRIQAVALPHVCEQCGLEEELPVPVSGPPPERTCPQCGGRMEPDEPMPTLPKQLLASPESPGNDA